MKSKVAFITIHSVSNFGSILQAIATTKVIESLGKEAILINYIPNRLTFKHYFMTMIQGIIPFVKGLAFLPNNIINRYIYSSYLAKYSKLSSPIYDKDKFIEKCPHADYYITGSDQVWNSKHNAGFNNRYFFAQLPDDSKLISFAASFGVSTLDKEDTKSVKLLLSRYKSISVRENSAVKIIEGMGLKCVQLLDPTFMLNRNEWAQYMNKRKIKKDYLLIYTPYNTADKKSIYEAARIIAKKLNLVVVTFSWDWRKESLADITITYASPGDFLSLMYYANYIITNSFHGTAFSINLNKQFSVFMPSAFSTRICSIIDLCGLDERIVSNGFEVEKIYKQIDYGPINSILERERAKSIGYLKNAFE